MSIRFGVSPIAWINDDMPELGAGTPLERVLEEIAAIGFEGVELGGAFPREPSALGALLRRHGLGLVGGWYGSSLLVRSAEEEWRAAAEHLALLRAMGSTVFICAETSNAIHGTLPERPGMSRSHGSKRLLRTTCGRISSNTAVAPIGGKTV